jgi:hypothetical protein
VVGQVDAWNSIGGAFNPNAFYTLSYTYNTSTGAVTDVEVGGNQYSFASPSVAPASGYVNFSGSSASFTDGYLANLLVTDSSVPEPASLTLLGMGGLIMLRRRLA